jgi:hypothetical protein
VKKHFQFKKHYTVEEARALLPQIGKWLQQIDHYRERLDQIEKRVENLLKAGNDIGGDSVNEWVRSLADLQAILSEFMRREIQIKDIERGLIDFPSLRDGREVFLCWEKGEEDIEHWHDLDSGFAGREPL